MNGQNAGAPKQYFHAAKSGPDPEGLKRAFKKSAELAVARGCPVINIALSTKNNLEGLMEDVLGEGPARLFGKNNELPLGSITLHLVTKRVPLSFEGPVLAAWVDFEHVQELSEHYRTKDLIYLPWLEEELVGFQRLFPNSEEI